MATSVMMTTSTGSPLASLPRVTPTVPNESVTVWPVSCWKAWASSVTMARTAPALKTRSSAPAAPPTPAPVMPAHNANAITARLRVVMSLSLSEDGTRPASGFRS